MSAHLYYFKLYFYEILWNIGIFGPHAHLVFFSFAFVPLYHVLIPLPSGILLALSTFYKGINGFMIKAGMVSDLPRIFQIYTFHLTARSNIFSNVRLLILRSLWFLGVCLCYFSLCLDFPLALPETCIHSSKQRDTFLSLPERRSSSFHQAEN